MFKNITYDLSRNVGILRKAGHMVKLSKVGREWKS